MTEPQIILDNRGNPVFAVIPWREYQQIGDLTAGSADTMQTDEELYDEAKSTGDEAFPIEVADRLLAGENPIKVYRSQRGMTQNQLAAAVSINAVYLSQIETGKRTGSARTLAAIATALNVDVGDLILTHRSS